jgi:hypothetical protein
LPGEERRGEEIMEMIIIREWYKIMKARERERDREIEIERREGSRESRRECEPRDTLQCHFWLLLSPPVSAFFLSLFS